jgi:hypothetical protein
MSGGGVSERHRGSDQARKRRVAQNPGFTRRTAINLPGVLNELTDRTGGSVNTATVAAIRPYRKSRFRFILDPCSDGIADIQFTIVRNSRTRHRCGQRV